MPSPWEQEILGDGASSQQLQMLYIYLIVAACVLIAYAMGCLGFSGAWPILLLAVLFHLWRVRIARLTRLAIQKAALLATRRRAMTGAESAEWLNFLINRWWAFSAESIQSTVKRALDYQLQQRRPAFLQSITLERFSLGEETPCVRELAAFEATEADRSLISATWANAGRPPQELYRSSQYRLVLETQLELHCDQFRMDFATRLSRLGLGPSISIGQLSLSGRLQLCVQLDLTARFPHVARVTAAFRQRPDVWFNLRISRAVNVAFVPVLRQWLRRAVEESLTSAMVDPGELLLYSGEDPMAPSVTDPIDVSLAGASVAGAASSSTICGVVTVTLRISKATTASRSSETTPDDLANVDSSSGIRICTMSLGREQRIVSREFPAGSACTQAASFFVRDLASEQIHIHLKNKSLFGGVAPVAKWRISLNEQPLKSTKIVQVTEVQKSACLSAQLEYTELPPLQLENVQPSQVYSDSGRKILSGALYIKVHGASNLLGMDRTGESDPYCVVFANRRKVGSTQYVKQTKNPKFDSEFHAFVADFTKTTVSFFLYDYDGRNALRDDFLGACHVQLEKDNPTMLFHQLPLGYSVAKHGQVASNNMGNLLFSIVFRPVPSVAKSELAKDNCGQLTDEELMNLQCADASPNRASISSEEGAKRDNTTDDNYSMNAGSFLARGLGVMEFNLVGAKDLMAMDRGGTSDPFVELRIGDEMLFRSKVSKATLEPRWNEWVTTRCPNEAEHLKLTVWDKDRIGKDYLGDLLLTLDDIKTLSNSASTRWFNLSGKGVKSGKIELGCKIVSEGVKSSKLKLSERLVESSASTNSGYSFTIHSARSLLNGKPVEAYVRVTSSSVGDAEIFRTKTEKKTERPYWGQRFVAPLGSEPIAFSVFSKNSFGKNDPLGTMELNLESIASLCTSSEPVWYQLTDVDGKPSGELSLECSMSADAASFPRISSDKSVPGRPVKFRLVGGRKLMAADFGGKSDPFVRVTLGNRLLYKSRTVKNSLEPQWNEEFTVPVPSNHAVTFTVMDQDAVGKDDYLGEVSLDPDTAAALGETWYKLKGPKVKSGEILLSCQLPDSDEAVAEIDIDEVASAEVFEDPSANAFDSVQEPSLAAESTASQQQQPQDPVIAVVSAADAELGSSPQPSPEAESEIPPPPPMRLKQPKNSAAPSHVEVTIVSGSNLMSADLDGTSDPYVVATLAGRQVHKTRVRRSTLNPVWRESFHVQLPDQGHLLRLATYDKDPVGKDDFLGEISLTRENLLQMCQLRDDSLIKLAGKNVTSGHLLLRCRRSPGLRVGEPVDASPGADTTARLVDASIDEEQNIRIANGVKNLKMSSNFSQDVTRKSRSSDNVLEVDCNKIEAEDRLHPEQKQQPSILLASGIGGVSGSGGATKNGIKLRRHRTSSLLRFLAPHGPRRTVSFSEDLQQLSPSSIGPNTRPRPADASSNRTVEVESRSSMELFSAGDSASIADDAEVVGTFQCDLLSLSGTERLHQGDRVYIKIKGDTSRRGGIGGRDLYKTRSYDVPAAPASQLSFDAAESFRFQSANLTTVSVLLKSAAKHKNIDVSSHSVANLVARAGGPPFGVALPECGASLALRLTRLPSATTGGNGGGGGGFGSLLRRRSRKSGFRSGGSGSGGGSSSAVAKDETVSNV